MSTKTDIVLLDILSAYAVPIAPNPWKVRFTLNYKKLNYRTDWVQDGTIEDVCRNFAIAPTGLKVDGTPHYTLPAIIDRTDPSNPVFLSDSLPIVEYLEKTYPSPPGFELFPANTKAFQIIFLQSVFSKSFSPIVPNLLITAIANTKCPEGRLMFMQRFELRFGKPFDTIEKRGAEREAALKDLEDTFNMIKSGLSTIEGDFLTGHQVSFCDFALAGWLNMIKTVSPDEVWVRVIALDEGRWGKYLDRFQGWMTVE